MIVVCFLKDDFTTVADSRVFEVSVVVISTLESSVSADESEIGATPAEAGSDNAAGACAGLEIGAGSLLFMAIGFMSLLVNGTKSTK